MTRQSKLTQDQNKVTVEYPQDVDQVTVKISTGDGQNQEEPVTKKLDFTKGQQGNQQGQQPNQDGQQGQNQQPDQGQQPKPEDEQQIQVQATQDEQDPHKITLKAIKFPQGVDKLIVDWGVQSTGQTPKELTKEKPEVAVKFSPQTKRITVTVDDEDNPETQPWTKAFKLGGGQQGQQQPGGGSEGGQSGSGQGSGSGQSSGGSGQGGQQSSGSQGGSGSGQGGQGGQSGKGGQSSSGSQGGSQ